MEHPFFPKCERKSKKCGRKRLYADSKISPDLIQDVFSATLPHIKGDFCHSWHKLHWSAGIGSCWTYSAKDHRPQTSMMPPSKTYKTHKRKLNSVSETGFGPSRKPRAACRGAADRAHLRTWALGVIQRYSRCQKNVKHPREGVILLSVVTYKHVSFKTQHKFIIFFLNCQKFERTCRHFHNLNVLL